MATEIDLLSQILDEMRQQNAAFGNWRSGAEDRARADGEAAEAAELLAKKEKEAAEAMNNLKSALGNTGQAFKSTYSAITSTEPKFEKFGDALSSASDALIDVAKNFGPVAVAAAYVVKGLTKAAEAALKQSDATLEAKDSLTKLGGAGVGTAESLLKLAHQSGITSKNLDALVKPMQSMKDSFLTLGATVADGQKAFMQMTQVTAKQRAEMGRLGYSQQELIQAQADYVRLQKVSGKNISDQAKDATKLRQASLDYAKNLVELAAISGTDLEGAKRAKEVANAQFAEQIRTRQEDIKIAELRKARRFDEANELEARQKNRKKMIEEVTAIYGKGTGEAYAQYMATGVVNEAVAPLLRQGNNLEQQRLRLEKAGNDEAKQREARAKNAQELQTNFNKTIVGVGSSIAVAGRELGDQFGVTGESLEESGKVMGRNEAEAREKANQAIVDQAKQGTDAMADNREKLRATQIALAVGMDKLVLAVNPLTSKFGLAAAAAAGLAIAAGAAAMALKGMAQGGTLDGVLGGSGTRGTGGAGKLGKIAGTVAKGAGIAAVGGIAGAGLQAAGESLGGTTGKVVSGAGTVASYASMGAMLGPWGALAGGVVGLGKAIYDNVKSTDEQTDTAKSSNNLREELARREEESQKKLREQTEGLKNILGENSTALSKFAGKLDTVTDEQFNKLVEELKKTGKITEDQVKALREQRAGAQQTAKDATTAAEPKVQEIAADKKFTTEDAKSLADKKIELDLLQKELFAAKDYQTRKAIEQAMETLRKEKKLLEDKKKAEDAYLRAEQERVEKEKKAQAEKQAAVDALERAKKARLEQEEAARKEQEAKARTERAKGVRGRRAIQPELPSAAPTSTVAAPAAAAPAAAAPAAAAPAAAAPAAAAPRITGAGRVDTGAAPSYDFGEQPATTAPSSKPPPAQAQAAPNLPPGGRTTAPPPITASSTSPKQTKEAVTIAPSDGGSSAGKQGMSGTAKMLADEMEKVYGITNPFAQRAIVMTAAKESGLDFAKQESGAAPYIKTLAKRGIDYIYKVFPQLGPKGRVAKKLGYAETGVPAQVLQSEWGKGDEEFFTMVYGGLGTNKNAADGYKFRGRGFLQLTGKSNYEAVSKGVGKDYVNQPDKIGDNFKDAAASVAGYLFNTRGKEKFIKDANSFSDMDSALKYTLNTVAGLGHKASDFDKKGSHLHEQLVKASKFADLAENSVQAAKGGIVNGPKSGFPATLHGKELITPLKPDSILEKLANTPSNITSAIQGMDKQMLETMQQGDNMLMDVLGNKLDKIATILENTQGVQEKTLRAVRL